MNEEKVVLSFSWIFFFLKRTNQLFLNISQFVMVGCFLNWTQFTHFRMKYQRSDVAAFLAHYYLGAHAVTLSHC
jgi:hypothetical protein